MMVAATASQLDEPGLGQRLIALAYSGERCNTQPLCEQVGSEVARRGKGLGFANVVAYDPYASEAKALALGVELVSFERALQLGDFFSLHMPLTPDTKVSMF